MTQHSRNRVTRLSGYERPFIFFWISTSCSVRQGKFAFFFHQECIPWYYFHSFLICWTFLYSFFKLFLNVFSGLLSFVDLLLISFFRIFFVISSSFLSVSTLFEWEVFGSITWDLKNSKSTVHVTWNNRHLVFFLIAGTSMCDWTAGWASKNEGKSWSASTSRTATTSFSCWAAKPAVVDWI